MQTVRGTQRDKPLEVEFATDTVFERSNIRRVKEDAKDGMKRGFEGWEYEETQYTYPEWHKKETLANKLAIAELAEAVLGGND